MGGKIFSFIEDVGYIIIYVCCKVLFCLIKNYDFIVGYIFVIMIVYCFYYCIDVGIVDIELFFYYVGNINFFSSGVIEINIIGNDVF